MTESIRHLLKKLKSWRDDDALFLCGLVVAVSLISFYLGRFSVGERVSEVSPPIMPLAPVTAALPLAVTSTGTSAVQGRQVAAPTVGDYVASKSGEKYHHISCPGANQIKEENKLFFQTSLQAEAAGYTRAANCER